MILGKDQVYADDFEQSGNQSAKSGGKSARPRHLTCAEDPDGAERRPVGFLLLIPCK